jgi:aspartate/tyrosine/aromatic aminotransferase
VGALTVISPEADTTAAVLSHLKICIRTNYSNPPAHGGGIVRTVLGDAQLTARWHDELTAMRERINGMRSLFVRTLRDRGFDRDMSFIERQRGMFSFSGLSKPQVEALRQKHAIYIVGSGRINVAGMTEANMDRLCEAIVDVAGG